MPNTAGEAAGGAHDATIQSDPTPTGCVVETGDGWSISAGSPAELVDLIDQKLGQARQAKTDAEAAIKKLESARKKAGR